MIHTIAFPGLGIKPFHLYKYFEVFGFRIHWYGVIIALGILLGFLLAVKEGKKRGVDQDTLLDIVIYGLPAAVICARLYYVIFEWEQYRGNWGQIFKIWEGGIAIYGAVIGAGFSSFLYCRIKKIDYKKVFDSCSFGLLVGQLIGRWGNFVNAEAYGGQTNLPWRMQLIDYNVSVHPTFFYESLWNLAVLGFLMSYRKKQKFDGEMFLVYLVGYGLGRVWIEGLRTDSLYLFGMRISQMVALLCVVVGVILIQYNRKRHTNIKI